MDDRPTWERELDALVRPALVVDPPAEIRRSILAAVLQATAPPVHPATPLAMPAPVAAAARPVPLAAYLLLAAVVAAYVAAISSLNAVLGGSSWLGTLLSQLLAVSDLVVGRPALGEPLALATAVLQRAPWVALLPLAWLLWERDRASVGAA